MTFPRPPFSLVANFVLFQAAWFAGVLLPLGWAAAAMAAVLAAHFAAFAKPGEWRLVAALMCIGGAWDTTLAATGVFALNKAATFYPPPLVPLWLLLLWGNFAITLRHSLRWLLGVHPAALFALGAVVGPAAYFGGAAITDKLAIPSPPIFAAASAPFWGALCAALPALEKRIK